MSKLILFFSVLLVIGGVAGEWPSPSQNSGANSGFGSFPQPPSPPTGASSGSFNRPNWASQNGNFQNTPGFIVRPTQPWGSGNRVTGNGNSFPAPNVGVGGYGWPSPKGTFQNPYRTTTTERSSFSTQNPWINVGPTDSQNESTNAITTAQSLIGPLRPMPTNETSKEDILNSTLSAVLSFLKGNKNSTTGDSNDPLIGVALPPSPARIPPSLPQAMPMPNVQMPQMSCPPGTPCLQPEIQYDPSMFIQPPPPPMNSMAAMNLIELSTRIGTSPYTPLAIQRIQSILFAPPRGEVTSDIIISNESWRDFQLFSTEIDGGVWSNNYYPEAYLQSKSTIVIGMQDNSFMTPVFGCIGFWSRDMDRTWFILGVGNEYHGQRQSVSKQSGNFIIHAVHSDDNNNQVRFVIQDRPVPPSALG